MQRAILQSEQFVLNHVEMHTNYQVQTQQLMVQQQIEEYNKQRVREPGQLAVEIPVEVSGVKQSSWGIGGATKLLKKGVQGAMKTSWVKMPSLYANQKAKTPNQEVVK